MSIEKARAAHPAFTGISRNHLDRLVVDLSAPFTPLGRAASTIVVAAGIVGASPSPGIWRR